MTHLDHCFTLYQVSSTADDHPMSIHVYELVHCFEQLVDIGESRSSIGIGKEYQTPSRMNDTLRQVMS